MKDLKRLYSEVVLEALSVGLDISDRITGIEVNSRLSRALGRCCARYGYDGYTYRIEINPCILANGLEDRISKNTIMHELIHTCDGCLNHGYEFQRRAVMVNRKLGYNVHTTTDGNALEAAGVVLKHAADNYGIVCKKCGVVVQKRKRWSSTLENIGNYRHHGCGGDLYVISLGKLGELEAANNIK